nr:uncharacterized protein LOC106629853 [Zonotrichia albicollis]
MSNTQLSELRKGRGAAQLQEHRGEQPRGSGMVTVHGRWGAQGQEAAPSLFQGCSPQGTEAELQGCPRGVSAAPCTPQPSLGADFTLQGIKGELQGCLSSSLQPQPSLGARFTPHTPPAAAAAQGQPGRMQQGLGCRALWIICIIFSDSLSFACLLLSRQRSSHEGEPVAVRTEGALPLTGIQLLALQPLQRDSSRDDSSCPSPADQRGTELLWGLPSKHPLCRAQSHPEAQESTIPAIPAAPRAVTAVGAHHHPLGGGTDRAAQAAGAGLGPAEPPTPIPAPMSPAALEHCLGCATSSPSCRTPPVTK